MEPAYRPGSRVWMSRFSYLFQQPARGDVVVIRAPVDDRRLELKRIIGLPDEEVSWSQGHFAINGVKLDEPYAHIPPAPPGDDERRAVRLGAAQYVVAGDNRLASDDSRTYGPVTRSAILGKILLR